MNYNFAITGGQGFLGRELCKQAISQGHKLHVLSTNPPEQVSHNKKEIKESPIFFKGNLLDKNDKLLLEFLDGADFLFHLAGYVSRQPQDNRKMMQIHVEGTRRIFMAAKQKKVKNVILTSSSGVVGISSKKNQIADDDYPYALEECLGWPYYASKYMQEKLAISLAEELGLKLVILRPSLLLGPGDYKYSSTGDVKNFLDQNFPAIPQCGLSFVDTRDVATGALNVTDPKLSIFDKIKDGEYRTYLLGAENMSFSDFMAMLSKLSGVAGPRLKISVRKQILGANILNISRSINSKHPKLELDAVKMSNKYWYIDSTRARKELNWHTRKAEETIQDTIDFIRQSTHV